MHNDPHILTLDQAIEHCEKMAKTLDCKDCAEEHRQLAEWLKELKVYKRYEECGYEMPKRDCQEFCVFSLAHHILL